MSLLKKAMEQASLPEDIATSQTVAILAQAPQEAAQTDYFSTDPASGYDAAQIAVRLFEGGFLDEFSDFLKEKNLTPNIVLANGLTLLQNSLMQFPRDVSRLNCLLELGANPNLFMRRVEEKGFGKSTYKAAYHPLNYAFANCPQLTTPDVCYALRKYGASTDGIKYHLEVEPESAVPDDETKARLRRELVAFAPDPECTSVIRQDVDLSVMQKELANIETQLAAAGFQVVTYVPPVKKLNNEVVLTPNQIGMMIEGKGVYMGTWEPKDRDDSNIGKTFNVFAAPEDLTDASGTKVLVTFNEAARQVTSLRNWHGHDGGNFANDTALYNALKNGTYNGEWFIPTRDLLCGKDLAGNKVRGDNLYDHRDTGDLKGTFTTASGSANAHWYWSCTEPRGNSSDVWAVRFSDGDDDWSGKDIHRLSCRPCRVEVSHLII